MTTSYPLRPFLPADTPALQDLFAQSIEELTADDYDEDQRLAWISSAADGEAFAKRLGSMTTLIVQVEGEYAGFASLKGNDTFEMLYVHPYYAGQGVGAALADAVERLLVAAPVGNVSDVQADDFLGEALEELGTWRASLDERAAILAGELAESHRRVRQGSGVSGRVEVVPSLPVDVLGVYVLLPEVRA